MENYKELLDQLRRGEIASIKIEKQQFLAFREVLVKDPQFKHFRGEAQQGGDVIYTFLQVPRS